jgi:hypothetical protein
LQYDRFSFANVMRQINLLLSVTVTALLLCVSALADDSDDDSTQNDNVQKQEFPDQRRLPQPPVPSKSLRPQGILGAKSSEYRVTAQYDGHGGYVINLLCVEKKYGYAFLKADVRVFAELAETLPTGQVIATAQKEAIITVTCPSDDDGESNSTSRQGQI